MTIDSAFVSPVNYMVSTLAGVPLTTLSVSEVPDGTHRRAELVLDEELVPGGYYTVTVSQTIQTVDNQSLSPGISLFQWEEHVPSPISIPFSNFSGEVSGGLLGSPDGLVFFSPAYDMAVANSVILIDSIGLCTRAYDIYEIPDIPDPPFLYTFAAPTSAMASSLLGAGVVLWAPAERIGLARVNLSDFQEDALAPPVDGPADAILVETIDITSAGFLNDTRWETFPAVTASLGPFTTAANLVPIGPGPTVNINLQPAPP
jgi:hypothetical protein